MNYSTRGKLGSLAKIQKYTPEQMTAKACAANRAKLAQRIDPDGSLQRDNPQLYTKRYNAALSERGLRAAEARWGAHRTAKANAAITEIVAPKKLLCAWCAHEQGTKIGRNDSSAMCPRHHAQLLADAQKIAHGESAEADATRSSIPVERV